MARFLPVMFNLQRGTDIRLKDSSYVEGMKTTCSAILLLSSSTLRWFSFILFILSWYRLGEPGGLLPSSGDLDVLSPSGCLCLDCRGEARAGCWCLRELGVGGGGERVQRFVDHTNGC